VNIAVLPGDGIGIEVPAEAVKVLRKVVPNVETEEAPIGMAGVDAAGDPLPPQTLALTRRMDAILFGAAGGIGEEFLPRERRPGVGLLRLRRELALFANFRPAVLFPELINASTLRPEIVRGLDIMILRELNGDIYFGEPRGIRTGHNGLREAINTMHYSEPEVERIGRVAFETARKRRKKVCSVDKANVLETSQLWRETMIKVGKEYPDVELTHLFVDAAAMMLIRVPLTFDVVVAGNMFGDILSDEVAMLTGSIGMLPSASINAEGKGLYEPVHGSAPDIAGKNIANPLAAIMSVAMMFRHSFNDEAKAAQVEKAVRKVLADGYRTADIYEPGTNRVGTKEMGDAVVAAL
jgi:3-isopropylmalate dehydrogenase